ncbi:MAG TPA: hypothetical protein VIG61_00200 [Fusobacterium sp.]|uniref:hypothetical protein n=1 Tax=Fusobacterium sp. TaxID=68766 RepID=UPI002F40DD49
MKKAVFCIGIFLLATMLIGCGTMNTRFRPYMEVKQEIQDVKAIVTRADRSGIYLALKNESKQEMEILWKDSKLGGDEVTHGTHLNLNDQKAERENTVIKAGEVYQTVLHRKSDIYYLDPVLYQPGGLKIRALQYPITLEVKVKTERGESMLELEIQQEESLYQKDVDARTQTKHLIPEMTEEMLPLREDKKVIKRMNQS